MVCGKVFLLWKALEVLSTLSKKHGTENRGFWLVLRSLDHSPRLLQRWRSRNQCSSTDRAAWFYVAANCFSPDNLSEVRNVGSDHAVSHRSADSSKCLPSSLHKVWLMTDKSTQALAWSIKSQVLSLIFNNIKPRVLIISRQRMHTYIAFILSLSASRLPSETYLRSTHV